MAVSERIWRTEGERYVRLLPKVFGITPKGSIKWFERVLTDFGCEHFFMQAARQMREHYGVTINSSAVRKDLTNGLKQNAVVPTYVLEYLLGPTKSTLKSRLRSPLVTRLDSKKRFQA